MAAGGTAHAGDLAWVAEVALLEGPAADRDGTVVVSDVIADRMYRVAGARLDLLHDGSGRANGNAFDPSGRLVTCEGAEHGPGGGRRIVRRDRPTDRPMVLVDRYRGGRLNSPNDLVVDDRGRVFFTDPRYGDRSDVEQDAEAVYRLDPDGTLERIVSQPDIERPNGIAIRPDGGELYVVDSNYDRPDGARRIWAFELTARGVPSIQRLVYDFGTGRGGDGMEVDEAGTLFVCAGIRAPRSANETREVPPGVYRISPEGRRIGFLSVPTDLITNCCFGGPDMRTLHVTAGHRLYTSRTEVPGWHAWRWSDR